MKLEFKIKHIQLVPYLLFFIWLQTRTVVGQTGNIYQYGFISRQENNEFVLQAVDVGSGIPTISRRFVLPIGQGVKISDAILNSVGTWIAIVLFSHEGQFIRLVNTVSGQIEDLYPPESLFLDSRRQQLISWAPDSLHIAFIGIQNNISDIYIYSVETKSTSVLTSDKAGQYRISWSPDASKIAVLTEVCKEEYCNQFIESFDASSTRRVASVMVGQTFGSSYDTFICNLLWSPDGRYLSYASDCDSGHIDAFKEVYVLNWQTQITTQITNYSNRADIPSNPNFTVRFADYDSLWYNNENLIVGTVFGIGDIFEAKADNETIAYNVSNQQTVTLAEAVGQDWHLNATLNLLAFRSSRVEVLNSFTPVKASIQVGQLDGNKMNILAEVPAGCDLAWSPDKDVLAYTDRGLPFTDCAHPVQGVHFLDYTTGKISEYRLNDTSLVYPVGWIVNNSTSS